MSLRPRGRDANLLAHVVLATEVVVGSDTLGQIAQVGKLPHVGELHNRRRLLLLCDPGDLEPLVSKRLGR